MDQAEQQRLNKQLLEAARDGDTEAVEKLLAWGAEVNARDNDGQTALHQAAGRGRTEVVEALLEAGADVHARKNNGEQALHWPAWFGDTETVKALLEAGAKVNARDNNGETALHWAAWLGRTEVVKALQEHERKNNPVCKAWRRLADWDAPQLPALFDPEQTDVCDFLEQLDSVPLEELDRQLAAAARYRRRDTHPVVRALNSWRGARPQAIPQPKSPGP